MTISVEDLKDITSRARTIWEFTDTTDDFSYTTFPKAISMAANVTVKSLDTSANQIAATIWDFHFDPETSLIHGSNIGSILSNMNS